MKIEDKNQPGSKRNYQPLIIAFLILLSACSITWAIRERGAKEVALTISQPSKVLKDPTALSVKKFADSAKQNHNTFDNTKNVVGGKEVAISETLVDTVAKISNIKADQIIDWKKISMETKARALKAEREVDSLKRETFFFRGKYLQLAFRRGNPTDTTDHGYFDFDYNADLSITQFIERGKILGLRIGAKKMFTDIYANDTNMTIKGLKTFRVQHNEQKFGFRIQAVSNYSIRTNEFLLGMGAQIDFGRLSVVGVHLYSPRERNFMPEFGAKFDLIRY